LGLNPKGIFNPHQIINKGICGPIMEVNGLKGNFLGEKISPNLLGA